MAKFYHNNPSIMMWMACPRERGSYIILDGIEDYNKGIVKRGIHEHLSFHIAFRELPMPEISRFFGIIIRMYFNDHMPPHFHAHYGEHQIEITIETLEILKGKLPNRVLGLVLEWASLHRDELRADWERARKEQPLEPIQPLE